ncbi:hypothetical protein G6730_05150 [Polynucleobacter paneuropaeus]|nr:hypothetical protein [Polynucleobacter paneuropaeus]
MRNVIYTFFNEVAPIKIKINWAALLSFAIFWIWGINAYPSGSNLNNSVVSATIIFLFGYFIFNYYSSNFQSILLVSRRSIIVFIFLTLILTILSWRHLTQPLWGDEIYHANLAARQGQLTIFLIENNFSYLWRRVKIWPASSFVWFSNFLMMVFFVFLFICLPYILKRHKSILVVLMISVMTLFRFAISGDANIFSSITEPAFLLHYDWDSHPVLRLLPLLLSSSVFGAFEFSYRLPGFLGYLLFLTFLFGRLEPRTGWLLGLAAAIAIGSLPVFWHVSYLVEQSIWSTLAASTLLVYLFSSHDVNEMSLMPLVSLTVFASLMRSPAFIAFGPVAIIIALQIAKRRTLSADYLPVLIVSLALALFVSISVLRGSPATESEGWMAKLLFAEINNIPAIAGASAIGLMPLFFIGFTFKVLTRDDFVKFSAILCFYILGNLVFYAPIARSLWGIGRYQAEMFVPLVASGVVAYCLESVNVRSKCNKWYAAFPLVILVAINFFSFLTFDYRVFRPFPENPTPGEAIKGQVEYPMKPAFQFIREHQLQGKVFYVGIYYGGYISSLMGFNATDYLAFTRLNNQYRDGFSVKIDAINADPNIESVLIEADADYSGVLQGLIGRGWGGRYDFSQKNSNHKMIILTRTPLL